MNFKMKLGKSNRFLVKNATIFGIFFLLMLVFLATFFIRSFIEDTDRKTVNNTNANVNNISSMSDETFFEIIKRLRYVATHQEISRAWDQEMPEELFFQTSAKVREYLGQMVSLDDSIDSVYVYCPEFDYVITSYGANPMEIFTDTSWLESFETLEENKTEVVYRKTINGINVVTFMLKDDSTGGVIINVNLEKHMKFNLDSYSVMLVDGDNEVIYKNEYRMSVDGINEVLRKKDSIVKYDGVYYAVARKASQICDFDYVLMQDISDYRQSKMLTYFGLILLFMLLTVIFAVVALYLAGITYQPIREIAEIIENPSSEKSKLYLSNDTTTRKIADSIVKMATNNENLRDDLNKRMGILNYVQLKALQWQINPHFIFNTLNMMYLMSDDIAGSESRLTKGILSLSGLMRYCLKTEPMLVELYDEMTITNEYIKLMNSRYGDCFEIIDGIDGRFYDKKVMKMCLQPILENCFQYGLKNIDYKGRITVSAFEEGDFFMLCVEDNGNGMTEEKLAEIQKRLLAEPDISEAHIGLANVHNRIVLVHGKDYGITVESTLGKGTKVTVKFPNS